MQKKVDQLVSLVQDLIRDLEKMNQNLLSKRLSQARFCLRSHDLIGLDIILSSFKGNDSLRDISNNDSRFNALKDKVFQLAMDIKGDFNKDVIPISAAEEQFLNLGYNKFFDICSEVYSDEFWSKSPQYRLSRISQAFSIYNELLNHKPFKSVLRWLSKYRPPMEAEISGPLFKFIRNVLSHFPFYDSWNEIWVSKQLVNWRHSNQSIDQFLEKFCGTKEVKYRFKEKAKQEFTYVTINFPKSYDESKIYLKDIINEEQGIKLALVMMIRVLNTQIETVEENA